MQTEESERCVDLHGDAVSVTDAMIKANTLLSRLVQQQVRRVGASCRPTLPRRRSRHRISCSALVVSKSEEQGTPTQRPKHKPTTEPTHLSTVCTHPSSPVHFLQVHMTINLRSDSLSKLPLENFQEPHTRHTDPLAQVQLKFLLVGFRAVPPCHLALANYGALFSSPHPQEAL